jgi:nitroreductase
MDITSGVNVYQAILARKSVRAFKDREVSDEILTRVLEAARHAPSANNFQEWRFVVVRNPVTRNKLSTAACRQKFVATAPVIIACCAATDNHVMTCGQASYPIDVAIAIDHITLCAASEGLGTCWIGAFYEDEVKKILSIPPEIRVVALLPIGYPKDPSPVGKFRLPLKKIVMSESWTSD